MAKAKKTNQFTMYLSDETAAMLEAGEEVWSYHSRPEFFEDAIKNQLVLEFIKIKAIQKRIGRALDEHVNALRKL